MHIKILRSNLVIIHSDKNRTVKLDTLCRVFDLKSLGATVTSLRAGCYGMYSRRDFFLEGVLDFDGEPREFSQQFLIKYKRRWVVNPVIIMYLRSGGTHDEMEKSLASIPNQNRNPRSVN
jgi:hypothetical protein